MSAIAVFDSGLGGLTVVKALRQQLPQERIIYFGDTARVPYGGKSKETVIRYVREISTFLLSHQVKALVIGCNTASAYAADLLTAEISLPIFNVIDPLIKEISVSPAKRIAVLGTSATVRSGIYQTRLSQALPDAFVTGVACPLFVPIVEEHFQNHPATKMVVEEYLAPVKQSGIDTVVLGCTHYPLLYQQIRNYLGAEVRIVDSALACAKQIQEALSSSPPDNSLSVKGELKYFVSDDPEKFKRLGEYFLGTEIGSVDYVEIK